MPFQICDISIALGSLKESNKKIEKSIGWKKGQIYKKTGIKIDVKPAGGISTAKQSLQYLVMLI